MTLVDRRTYLFCEAGAFSIFDPSYDAILAVNANPANASRPWSLIDSDEDRRGPPATVRVIDIVFPVQCFSPDPVRYKTWMKNSGLLWIILPWDDESWKLGLFSVLSLTVRRSLVLAGVLKSPVTDEDRVRMQEARIQCGPCIRDVIGYFNDRDTFFAKTNEAVNKIKKTEEIVQFMDGTHSSGSEVSHQLFVLYRVDKPLGTSDGTRLECKSAYALEALARRYNTLELREAEALF